MSRYQKYPAYKDSGVEWIGEIPEHWEVKPVRHVFKIYSGSTPKSGEEIFWDGDIVWLTPEDLGNNQQKYISESRRKITEEGYKSCGTSLAKANSIALSTRAPIGHIALSTVAACCNQGCRILEPEKGYSDYWYYTMVSAKPIIQSLGQGSTFMELPRQSLAGFKLPVPPLEEQQAIASFLDMKTAQIDELISKKELLLNKLAEKRTAIITQAVTNGIDPSVSMKKSGISWIGEIPEHWEEKRLKDITSCNDESLAENTESQYEIKYIDISSVNMNEGIINKETLLFEKAPSRARRIVRHGDTIVSTVRTYLKAIARIIDPEDNLIVSTGFAVIRPKGYYSSSFLGYFLQTEGFVGEVVSHSVGVSYPAINSSELLHLPAIIPPYEEQEAIAQQINKKTVVIDSQKAQICEAIERLKEFRTALITDAVTGKMDVHSYETKESFLPEQKRI